MNSMLNTNKDYSSIIGTDYRYNKE